MFKIEFVNAFSEKHGCTRLETEAFLTDFFDTVIESCLSDGFVQITGYGTFEHKYTGERKALNPRTGEEITVQPKSSIRFKPGKRMRDF